MVTLESARTGNSAQETNNLDYSKSELEVKNIVIPNSAFMGKWVKGKGYAIGYENIKITKDYETLEEALNQVGYGVDKDDEGDETLAKFGETNFETIVNIINAVLTIREQNNGTQNN